MAQAILVGMRVLVKLFGEFREAAGSDRVELDVPAEATVGDVLTELARRHPKVGASLYDDEGEVRAYLHVFLNGENVEGASGLRTSVDDGDTVTFFPPVGGG